MPELEKVISRIKADIRTAFFRKDMGYLCIEVMKRIPQILLVPTTGVYDGESRSREQVHPRTTQGHIERSTVLHNRSFKLYSSFQKSQHETAPVLLQVSVIGTYIDHRRKPSAVTGRETTFIEIDILDNVCIECRKQSSGMVHLIQGSTVQQKQVFIVVAAMHVQSGDKFRPAGYSRETLKFLHHIGRTHKVVSAHKILCRKRHLPCLSNI